MYDYNDSRNSSEHSLEDGEQEIGNLVTSYGRRSQNTLEAEVVEVTDVAAGCVGEGQRITPEEPLE